MSEANPGNLRLTRDEAICIIPDVQVATTKLTELRFATSFTGKVALRWHRLAQRCQKSSSNAHARALRLFLASVHPI